MLASMPEGFEENGGTPVGPAAGVSTTACEASGQKRNVRVNVRISFGEVVSVVTWDITHLGLIESYQPLWDAIAGYRGLAMGDPFKLYVLENATWAIMRDIGKERDPDVCTLSYDMLVPKPWE